MGDYTDLYDPEELCPEDTGNDNARIVGHHTEQECRYYRDEMARREGHCAALGVGRQYRELVAATRGRLAGPVGRTFARHVPENRRLSAPEAENPHTPSTEKEDA